MAFRASDNRKDPLTVLDDEDDMSPEDEVIEMVTPDGFRLQESRPATIDNYFVKHRVLVRLRKHGVVWWPDHSQESGAHERIVRLPCTS